MWLWFKTKLPAKWQAEQDKIQSQLIAQIWYEILTRSLLVYCNTLSYSGNRWIDWNGGYGILEDQSIQSWKRVDVSKVWRWSGIRKIFNWYFQNSINSKYTSEEDIGFPYQDSSPHSLLSTGIHQFIKFRGEKYGVQIVHLTVIIMEEVAEHCWHWSPPMSPFSCTRQIYLGRSTIIQHASIFDNY